MATATATAATERASEATRWGQLVFGIICMVMIANLQYGWTLFVNPIDQKFHWGKAAIQVAFTIFVLTETWLVPLEGYLIDKFGPRVMISISGALVAIAWVINSMADSLGLLYIGAAVGGIGAGVIYGGSVGNALKWFPDRRGLAAGLTAAGKQYLPRNDIGRAWRGVNVSDGPDQPALARPAVLLDRGNAFRLSFTPSKLSSNVPATAGLPNSVDANRTPSLCNRPR